MNNWVLLQWLVFKMGTKNNLGILKIYFCFGEKKEMKCQKVLHECHEFAQ